MLRNPLPHPLLHPYKIRGRNERSIQPIEAHLEIGSQSRVRRNSAVSRRLLRTGKRTFLCEVCGQCFESEPVPICKEFLHHVRR